MPAQSLQSWSTFSSLSLFSNQPMMAFNQWSARGWCSVTVVMAHYSSNRTEVTFMFPVSDMTTGARVVAHMVFPTFLTASVCLLMSGGGRTEFGESIFVRSAVVTVPSRESVLTSTSSLVPRDVPEKHLMTVSLDLLETTVGCEEWRYCLCCRHPQDPRCRGC